MKFQCALLLFLMCRNIITGIYESISDNNSQLMVASRPNISLFRCIRFDGARNLIHKFVYYIMQTQLGPDRTATCAFWCCTISLHYFCIPTHASRQTLSPSTVHA